MQYLGIDISKAKFDVALIVDIKNPEKVKQKTSPMIRLVLLILESGFLPEPVSLFM